MQREKDNIAKPDSKDGWKIEDLSDEASLAGEDQIKRQILRGDESKGDPDKRDNAGAADSEHTPQGREEAKPDHKGVANKNG
ncbi:MAG: hypothetical protein H7070_14380 [Saprospiraceae bacterium]|nr:hypothetical protein [Pyrinomonadaceae bacterium]